MDETHRHQQITKWRTFCVKDTQTQKRRQKLHYLSTLLSHKELRKLYDWNRNDCLIWTCFQQLKDNCNSYDCSPPTKLIITDYKNVPKHAKNAAIKFSYKPHDTKTPQSPLKVYSQTCCRRPQHNWVDAEWKSPLSNYLTMLWGRVERHMWANLSTSMKYAGRSGW